MSEDLITQFVTLAEDLGVEGLAKTSPDQNEDPINTTVEEETEDDKTIVTKIVAESLEGCPLKEIKKEPKATNFSKECGKCQKVFNNGSNFIKHVRLHDNPTKNSSNATMVKLPERDSDGLLKCFDCNKKVKCNSNFRRHVRIHHLKILFKCDECDFQHREAAMLSRHRRKHKLN